MGLFIPLVGGGLVCWPKVAPTKSWRPNKTGRQRFVKHYQDLRVIK